MPNGESRRAGSETQKKKKKKGFFLLLKKCLCLRTYKHNNPINTLHFFFLATTNKFSKTLKLS